MHSKQYLIVLIAALVAFAGAAAVGADAEGAEAEPVLKVEAGGSVLTYPSEDGIVTMPTLDDVAAFYTVPDSERFVSWIEKDGSAVYMPGQQYAISADLTVEPKTEAVTDVYFVVDGTEYSITYTDAESLTIPAEAEKAVKADADRHFAGWEYGGKVYADLTALKAIEGLSAGAVFTATFEDVHTVTWIVDGITIATGDTVGGIAMPSDPTKEHYTFAGWFDAEGVAYSEDYVIDADVAFTAKFVPVNLTVTFTAGGEVVGTSLVPYGQTVLAPALPDGYESWAFDFSKAITADTTIEAVASAVEPSDVYTVTFAVDGKVIATYASDAITVPADPVKEGYAFQGWAIGDSVIADPASYAYTADTTLTALFKAVEVVEHVVQFVTPEGVTEIRVADGSVVDAPAAPEGMQWDPAVDLDAPVTMDMAVNAVPLTVTVTFAVDGEIVAILTQTIPYGGVVDTELLSGYTFPEGYDSWDADLTMPVYADMTVEAKEIVVVEAPGFFESPVNVLLTVLAVVILAAFVGSILYLRHEDRLPKQLAKLARKPKIVEKKEGEQ